MNRLDELVCAARDVPKGAPERAAQTRRTVLGALAMRKRRGKHASVGLLLVAAVAGGTAWAATPSWRWSGGARSEELESSPKAMRAEPTAVSEHSAARTASVVATPAIASAVVAVAAPPSAKPRAASAPSAVNALYEQAHRAHFVERDYRKALGAWERYLSVAPRDPRDGFAIEARYNRAMCLLRLGRLDEGKAALEPFAQGEYRETEARRLLDLLK